MRRYRGKGRDWTYWWYGMNRQINFRIASKEEIEWTGLRPGRFNDQVQGLAALMIRFRAGPL
jgi:hypothetical protein